jgi:IclR family KDG regulon transcriptional repressor
MAQYVAHRCLVHYFYFVVFLTLSIDNQKKPHIIVSTINAPFYLVKQTRNESIIRAFSIIEYLAGCEDWVGLRTLARDLGIDASTAYRFLASLKELGYVTQDPDHSRYQLTLKFAWLSAKVLDKVQLRHGALPFLEDLRGITNETTHLAVREGNQIVYIAKLDAQQPMQMRSRIGDRGYLHSTALGRAILAHLPLRDLEALLPRLETPILTKNTITNLDALHDELKRVRERGYAIDNEENEVGIRCVAAPVFDHVGQVAGAVSLSGWTISMTLERVAQLSGVLLNSCGAISRKMGYLG